MTTTESELKNLSMKDRFLLLPRDQQQKFMAETPEEELEALLNSWRWTARPNQIAPDGDWHCWLFLAGRGAGKTRTASEFIISRVMNNPQERVALIGRTSADVRDVMIEGVSGILAIARLRGVEAHYEPSKRRVTFGNGAMAIGYSAEEPNLLRGPEHSLGWLDELATFVAAKENGDAYENFLMGLRLGDNPQYIVTTTPRQHSKALKKLLEDPSTHVSRGKTLDNAANLPKKYLKEITERYEGTRLGRQELDGELLESVEGAYWSDDMILRIEPESVPTLEEIVVAVDPAVSVSENSDYTAITVSGSALVEDRENFYVLHSEQVKLSPNAWAERVNFLFDKYQADTIICEKNNGGDLLEATIHNVNPNLPVELITAKRGKTLRAAPIVALYEQKRVHHVGKHLGLEEQMVQFPSPSLDHDDAVDSLTYSLLHLSNLKPIEESQFMTFRRPRF